MPLGEANLRGVGCGGKGRLRPLHRGLVLAVDVLVVFHHGAVVERRARGPDDVHRAGTRGQQVHLLWLRREIPRSIFR